MFERRKGKRKREDVVNNASKKFELRAMQCVDYGKRKKEKKQGNALNVFIKAIKKIIK